MQTMEEEFIFYSDDEDEKEVFPTGSSNIMKNSPSKFKLPLSLSPLKLYQSNSNHENSPTSGHNNRASTNLTSTYNNRTSTNLKQFDWSATTYSSLLRYSNYFDSPPIDTNYFAPKPLEQNYFDSQPLSTITNTLTECDNQPKHNPYQTDPIHKQISNLINDTRPIHNHNSSTNNSSPLRTIIEKPCSHSYQSLILDQHQKENPERSSSVNYSSDSFSTPSPSYEPTRNNPQNIESNTFNNQITNTDINHPYNPSQNPSSHQKPSHPQPLVSPKPRSTTPQPPTKKLTKTTSWSQIASKPAAPLPTPPPCLPSPKHTPSPPPTEPTTLPPPEYHRGPKVDPRWPIDQQLFLGPIPVIVTWDEIRTAFYNKINRQHVVHTYVQSKPVNEVVYGMIVFDKATTATKILKEGPITVKGYLISVSPMCQRLQARKK